MPCLQFRLAQLELRAQEGPALWPAGAQHLRHLQPALDGPLCHPVGIGVVVDPFVIFIRADHVADVIAAVGFQRRPAGPEARRLQQDLGARRAQKRGIAGRLPVVPDGVGDVGADVLLVGAAADRDDPSIRHGHIRRRYLLAGVCRFPGVERAAIAQPRGLGARGRQGMEAVHQQRTRRCGPGECVERQQEDLGIPEDMAEVGLAGQRPCADRDTFVLGVGGADQVVEREAERTLRCIVAFNDNIAGSPALAPGLGVCGQ